MQDELNHRHRENHYYRFNHQRIGRSDPICLLAETKVLHWLWVDPEQKCKIIKFSRDNSEYFAWSYEEMKETPPQVVTPKLNVNPNCHPIKKKKRNIVAKLLNYGFIQEVKYLYWLADVMAVPKE